MHLMHQYANIIAKHKTFIIYTYYRYAIEKVFKLSEKLHRQEIELKNQVSDIIHTYFTTLSFVDIIIELSRWIYWSWNNTIHYAILLSFEVKCDMFLIHLLKLKNNEHFKVYKARLPLFRN